MERPEPFVQTDSAGKLVISGRGREILSSLNQPLTVVAVAGLYRTGKSFLLNRLAGKQSGFPLGSTVQSKTKGIWIWTIPHPSSPRTRHLVLLDTEGLADPEKGNATHDAWIFCLAVLLSSCFVYNSIGTIDERAIEGLHYITELTERIRIKSGSEEEESGEDYDAFFPSFYWVLRDFMLELNIDGRPCTATDYLENSLKLRKGVSKAVTNYNLPRQALKTYFPTRKCFTLIRPVDKEEDLRNMEELKDLKPEFVKDVHAFCKDVFENVSSKSMAGREINGPMLISIAESYLEAINKGAVPCIGNAFKTMAEIENNKAVTEGVNAYESIMKQELEPKMPVSLEELSDLHEKSQKQAIQVFLSMAIADDTGRFHLEMQTGVVKKYEYFTRANEEASTKKCTSILENLYKSVRDKIQVGHYSGPGGHAKYQTERTVIHNEYNRVPNKGVSAAKVMATFNAEHRDEAQAILVADKALSKKERELEEANREIERKELATKAEKERTEELKQCMIDQQRSQMISIQEIERKKAEDMEIMRKEFERKMNKIKEEQNEQLMAGFKEQAELMKEQMDSMKELREQMEQNAKEQMEDAKRRLEQHEKELEAIKKNPPKENNGGFLQFLGKAAGALMPVVLGGVLGKAFRLS